MGMNKADILHHCLQDRVDDEQALGWIDDLYELAEPQAAILRSNKKLAERGLELEDENQRLRALITAHNDRVGRLCRSGCYWWKQRAKDNNLCEDCPRRYKIEVDNG